MSKEELHQWLFENGGPVIRYRTSTELLPPSNSVNTKHLRDEMLRSPVARAWLERLVPPVLLGNEPITGTPRVFESVMWEIHGSKPTVLENTLAKLTEFGMKKGMPELDKRTFPYINWFKKNAERPIYNVYEKGSVGFIATFIVRAGYIIEPAMGNYFRKRLNTVYEFIRNRDYDIYVPGKHVGNKPFIKPELTADTNFKLPSIYDIVGWAAYLPKFGTKNDNKKVNAIINYIMNEEYQKKIVPGYGWMTDGSGRSWSMGWSVHLPEYPGIYSHNKSVVQMIGLLMNFEAAREHQWFKDNFNRLERHQTGKGTYLFPASFLQERLQGYWVNGVRMGLGETGKKRLELESTFWMCKFKKQLRNKL